MKVILIENLSSGGKKGDIKDVSDGFAINFLIPQGKAILATPGNIGRLDSVKNKLQAKTQEQIDTYQKIINTLNKQSINFSGKISDKENLFKGISIKDIITEVKQQFNLEINEKWFVKTALLKKIGRHTVSLRLSNNKVINFFINIKSEV